MPILGCLKTLLNIVTQESILVANAGAEDIIVRWLLKHLLQSYIEECNFAICHFHSHFIGQMWVVHHPWPSQDGKM
jgi:hypothetical protein